MLATDSIGWYGAARGLGGVPCWERLADRSRCLRLQKLADSALCFRCLHTSTHELKREAWQKANHAKTGKLCLSAPGKSDGPLASLVCSPPCI